MSATHGKPARPRKSKKPPQGIGTRARRWLRKHQTLMGLLVAVPIVAGLVIFFADPFSTPTARDASGNKVKTGVIETEGAAPRERRPAPNFVLADYDGNAVRLDDFRGKTVLLNFWATWCTTCEAEMPDMQRLAEENPDDFVVLAANQAEGRGRAKSWSDARGLTAIKFVLDSEEAVTRAYKLPSGLPHSFFIDRDGIVRVVKHGGMRFAEMKQLLEETRAAVAAAPN